MRIVGVDIGGTFTDFTLTTLSLAQFNEAAGTS